RHEWSGYARNVAANDNRWACRKRLHDTPEALPQVAASLSNDLDPGGPWTRAIWRHGNPHPPAAVRRQSANGIGKTDTLKSECHCGSSAGGKPALSGSIAGVAGE